MRFQEWKRIQIDRLSVAGIAYPEDELRVILTEVLAKKRATLPFDPNVPIYSIFDQDEIILVEKVIAGRIDRKPLAYLLGEQYFYRDAFLVGPGVLIPRPDSELLVGAALHVLGVDDSYLGAKYEVLERYKLKNNAESIRVMDLCTGSGCIGISIANVLSQYLVEYQIILTEISEMAAKFTRENIKRADEPDRIELVMCDLFPSLSIIDKQAGKFQLIVANPPYISDEEMHTLMSEVGEHEPKEALSGGLDGLHFYERILSEAFKYLCDSGVVALEHGYLQKDSIEALFKRHGFEDIACLKDFGDNDRVTIGRLKSGGVVL